MAKKKEKLIKDLKTLENTFILLGGDKATLGLSLIEKALFLQGVLARLEADIASQPVAVEMPQGNYSITRSNPSISSYNTTLKSYTNVIKMINDLLPVAMSIEDEFDKFNE